MRKGFLIIALLLISVMVFSLPADIKILNKTANFIDVEVNLSKYNIDEGKQFSSIDIPNWNFSSDQGAPLLPLEIINVAIPKNGDVSLVMLDSSTETKQLQHRITPVPLPVKSDKTYDFEYIPNEEKYKNSFVNPITKMGKRRFRYYEFCPIRITPFVFENSTLTVYKKMLFRIEIKGNKSYYDDFNDKFEDIEKDIFVNYQFAKGWQTKVHSQITKFDFSKSDFWYHFDLKQFGLIKIDALEQLPSFADYNSIRLFKAFTGKDHKLNYYEIPRKIDKRSVFFYNNKDNENRTSVIWVTFGGKFKNPPLKLDEISGKNPVKDVTSFERYTRDRAKDGDQADCIIVYPAVFGGLAAQLAEFQNNELNVKTVIAKQEDIINDYAGGLANHEAIENYLKDAYENWTEPAPQYVILLGSGTYKGLVGFDDITLSDWYAQTTKNKVLVYGSSGEDARFVRFYNVGDDERGAPQLAISRIPAITAQEFNLYFDRMEKYFTELPKGMWQNKITILADDELKSGKYEGLGEGNTFNHTEYAQIAQELINPSVNIDKVLGINYELNEFNEKPGATDELIKRLNEGRLVWYYIGHGNHDVMGDESYFVGSTHIDKLYNEEHLPLMLAASCSIGEYDSPDFNSIGERLLFGEHGGAIATVSASRGCSPTGNFAFMNPTIDESVNKYHDIGQAVIVGKIAEANEGKLYNLFGSPLLMINPPKNKGVIEFSHKQRPYEINKRETAHITGTINSATSYDSGKLTVYDSPKYVTYVNYNAYNPPNDSTYFTATYSKEPNLLFTGDVEIENNSFNAGFIVPDEANDGNAAKILCYSYDEETNNRVLSVKPEFTILDNSEDVVSHDKPKINLYVDSERFQPGDVVSSSPTIYATISDTNGINITAIPGRKILLLLEDSEGKQNLVDVTGNFSYKTNSFTEGSLEYQLTDLDNGKYNGTLFAYDNFGDWNSVETYFNVKKSSKIEIFDVLPYPNPMKNGGRFTFLLSESADVTLDIYTITGKKIKHLSKNGCNANYNELLWNGKDEENADIANGTYFYKIRAKSIESSDKAETIGKLIILK